jgi:hypothetical protein
MEPPAKRLRILQSVEVDETNPDYIVAKQKQQQRFKGRLESLFAKYEGMHESMSDEIDFRTNKVVVDRGHLRRVQRQMGRKETTLLDSFLEKRPEQDDMSEKEEEEDKAESDDELAPTQIPQKKMDSIAIKKVAHPQRQHEEQPTIASSHTLPSGYVRDDAPQIPNTSTPAMNLLQHVQFPQTPLGQQAQAAFYANLNQTIAQAVQQAVAPLLSSVFQTTPSSHAPQAPVFPVQTQQQAIDNVRPATDPKWYFPPMSVTRDVRPVENERSSPPVMDRISKTHSAHKAQPRAQPQFEFSSPSIPRRRSPKVAIPRKYVAPDNKPTPTEPSQTEYTSAQVRPPSINLQVSEGLDERRQSSHSLPELSNETSPFPVRSSPKVKIREIRPIRKKYNFTEAENIYISQKRKLQDWSYREIKASKAKWSSWPLSAFYHHWSNYLKDRQLHLLDASKVEVNTENDSPTPPENEEQFFSSKEIPETSSASHHLPTPSSLGQDYNHTEKAIIPSSSHFDDDELELLSLAGADVSEELLELTNYDDDEIYPAPDRILPSIEGAEFRTEDELQMEMLKTEESEDEAPTVPKVLPSTIPETQESAVAISSPARKRKTNPKPIAVPTYRAASDSDDNLDLVGVDEDGPPTPFIKRESLTPQASKFLCSSPALKTPRPIPRSSGIVSSGAKSTGKLDRRAYLKEVKQSWTKKTPGSKTAQKRRSLNGLVGSSVAKKRAWAEVGDSEDELAG